MKNNENNSNEFKMWHVRTRATAEELRKIYDYFEEHKKLPVIGVNAKSEYVMM